MKVFLSVASMAIILFGCSNSNQTPNPTGTAPDNKQVVITNDMENAAAKIPSWIFEKAVVKMENGPAHSGEFVTKVDDKTLYSYAYRETLQNINQELPKRIVVNGWVNSPDPSEKLAMILDINDNNVTKFWRSYSLQKTIKTPGQWHEFTCYFTIDKPIESNYQVKIFGFSGNKTAYFDDLKITFEY